MGVTDQLIRLSVGIENAGDLIPESGASADSCSGRPRETPKSANATCTCELLTPCQRSHGFAYRSDRNNRKILGNKKILAATEHGQD